MKDKDFHCLAGRLGAHSMVAVAWPVLFAGGLI
jgi:hypothetical protein